MKPSKQKSNRRTFRLVCKRSEIPKVESLLQAEGYEFIPLPFSDWARETTKEPKPLGSSIAANFGLIYIQDKSSMLPPLYLDLCPRDMVLDMCSSPGGKAGFMSQLVGDEGLVLANEPISSRLDILRRNIHQLNLLNVVTSKYKGQNFPFEKGSFSRILLDAPCSGWGTVDKIPQITNFWREDNVSHLIKLQRELLYKCASILYPGGKLLYSTCTTNVKENEEQILWIQDMYELEPIDLALESDLISNSFSLNESNKGLRINGPESGSHSFFLACMKKPNGKEQDSSKEKNKTKRNKERRTLNSYSKELNELPGSWEHLPPGKLRSFKKLIEFLPQKALQELPNVIQWRGFPLGREHRHGIRLSPRSRRLLPPVEETDSFIVSDIEDLQKLMTGQSLQVNSQKKQIGLYWYDLPLGWLTVKGNRGLWAEWKEFMVK